MVTDKEGKQLKPDAEVFLLVEAGGKQELVGKARLMPDKDGKHVSRSLHGTALKVFVKKAEDLLSIRRPEISAAYKNLRYPYSFGGPEGPPKDLGEMHPAGMYAWDANMMQLTTQTSASQSGGSKERKAAISAADPRTGPSKSAEEQQKASPTTASGKGNGENDDDVVFKGVIPGFNRSVRKEDVENNTINVISDTSIDLSKYKTMTVQVTIHRIARPRHNVRSIDSEHKSKLRNMLQEQGMLSAVKNLSVTIERNERPLSDFVKGNVLIDDCILIDGIHRLEVFSELRARSETWRNKTNLLHVTLWLRPDGKNLTGKEILSIGNKLNRVVSNVLPMFFADRVHTTVSFIFSSIEDDDLCLEQMNPNSVAESMGKYGTLGKYDNRTLRRYADIGLCLARSPELLPKFEEICEKVPRIGITHLSDDRLYKLDASAFEFCVECVQALLDRRGGNEGGRRGRFEDMRVYFYTFALQLYSYCTKIAEEKQIALADVFAREMTISVAEKTVVRTFLVVQLAKLEPSATVSLWEKKLARKMMDVEKKLERLFELNTDDSHTANSKKTHTKVKVAEAQTDAEPLPTAANIQEQTNIRKSTRITQGKKPEKYVDTALNDAGTGTAEQT